MIQQQTSRARDFLGSGNNQACFAVEDRTLLGDRQTIYLLVFDTLLTASLGSFTLGSIKHLFQSCDTDLCDTLRYIKAVPNL